MNKQTKSKIKNLQIQKQQMLDELKENFSKELVMKINKTSETIKKLENNID